MKDIVALEENSPLPVTGREVWDSEAGLVGNFSEEVYQYSKELNFARGNKKGPAGPFFVSKLH
jgi:hypothetical protein